MLNRAQIEASNNRIENLRFRRGMRRLSIAFAGAGISIAALCDGMNQFHVAMIASAFPDRPWYVPLLAVRALAENQVSLSNS